VGDDEAAGRLGPGQLRELAPVDAAEARVEPAPAGHAVYVGRDLALRQGPELVVAQAERRLDLAGDGEVPRRQLDVRHRAGVQDRPFLGQVLARRQARGVVTGVADLLLGAGSEQWHAA